MGERQRIAILGGGMGALSCAWMLTERSGWQQSYDVTVYEQGWRLGGKGASGRNLSRNARIEEHGLHLWHGFYENAFALVQRCYAELGRPAGAPLATWAEAFTPIFASAVQEQVGGEWITWPLLAPPREGIPGDGAPLPGIPETLVSLLEFVVATLRQLPRESHWLNMLVEAGAELVAQGLLLLKEALGTGEPLLALVERWGTWLQREASGLAGSDLTARRLFILIDLAGAITRGILTDQVASRGFSALDDEELSAWLSRHGASSVTLASAMVRGIYQAAFAYPGGDANRPGQLAAGTALRGFLRFLSYKGAPLYRMNAGMGDVVFAPIYQVLRRRGVQFRFFHRVEGLHLTADGQGIAGIDLTRTAQPKRTEYEPLVEVNGLPCWPSEPLAEQLQVGDEPLRMAAGTDFDWVVLGIPLGALPGICSELIARSPAWRAMVERVATVPTLAMQLWCEPDLAGLGWNQPGRLVGTYAEPFDTWMEMSHLLPREAWTPVGVPGSLAYLCGPMPEPPAAADPAELVRAAAVTWLEQHAQHLWPAFDWRALVDAEGRTGPERMNAQYWRANTDPSERYVLSLPGTTGARLPAGGSGFANLALAGDWVRTGLDAGCIEAAVMAGMQASRVICGYPTTVFGETDRP